MRDMKAIRSDLWSLCDELEEFSISIGYRASDGFEKNERDLARTTALNEAVHDMEMVDDRLAKAFGLDPEIDPRVPEDFGAKEGK